MTLMRKKSLDADRNLLLGCLLYRFAPVELFLVPMPNTAHVFLHKQNEILKILDALTSSWITGMRV